jgi:hypothetical protein
MRPDCLLAEKIRIDVIIGGLVARLPFARSPSREGFRAIVIDFGPSAEANTAAYRPIRPGRESAKL